MSKHLSRKDRWVRQSVDRYSCEAGRAIHERDGWYAVFDYRVMSDEPSDNAEKVSHQVRLGPFKRPRNAMVALEREVTALKNRYEKRVLFGAEA